jgi:DNA topoisomerase-3
MAKALYIAEKPSVAKEFAKALKINGKNKDGYIESEDAVVTWCVGHLVTMSYPESYDPALKKWSLETLPFIPETYRYEVIQGVKKQFDIVKTLMNRDDVDTIYVCTDSGREGEYIYRLVAQMAGVKDKKEKRVWIDSQTEEEILKGIQTAKDLSAYDNLSSAAYLRAKEDYLMGINFSRVLTLKYGRSISNYLKLDRFVLSVGRVMTCVLGMVVRREREIRSFVETPFYRVIGNMAYENQVFFDGEWKVNPRSKYFESPYLYKENGFKEQKYAEELIAGIRASGMDALVEKVERKKEKKNPPLLYNLAELQNECSKLFKISPDETLKIVQDLYERKCVTYPRTDARVLSTAVAKEIHKNIKGLTAHETMSGFANEVLGQDAYKNIAKTRYVDDKQITDHYAIIPTGQGLQALKGMTKTAVSVYELIAKRFLSIFYPPAVYEKLSIQLLMKHEKPAGQEGEPWQELFTANFKVLVDEGYLKVAKHGFSKKKNEDDEVALDAVSIETLKKIKKGDILNCNDLLIKEGKTSPPKRYNSGSMILAMESAGQLIEDEELRAQIKGSGIGTSATRAEILKKLININYIALNKKTQIITPTQVGEMVYEVVAASIYHLLNPELTASWEKGLTYVAQGEISEQEYMEKLNGFVTRRTMNVVQSQKQGELYRSYDEIAKFYK